MSKIQRAKIVRQFAKDATDVNLIPREFGTGVVVSVEEYEKIANKIYEKGLEALPDGFNLQDFTSILLYQSTLTKYLYQQGIAEYSPFQDYEAGSVVSYNNSIWLSKRTWVASQFEVKKCIPCEDSYETVIEGTASYPVEGEIWEKLITEKDTKKLIQISSTALTEQIETVQTNLDTAVTDITTKIENNDNKVKQLITTEIDKIELFLKKVVVQVATNEDGYTEITYGDGRKETIKIDTDQVTVESTDDKIIFKNEDGSEYSIDKTVLLKILKLPANTVTDTDQVKSLTIEGDNLVITNEDDSKVTLSITELVTKLNSNLATDAELSTAISGIEKSKVEAGKYISVVKTNDVYTVSANLPNVIKSIEKDTDSVNKFKVTLLDNTVEHLEIVSPEISSVINSSITNITYNNETNKVDIVKGDGTTISIDQFKTVKLIKKTENIGEFEITYTDGSVEKVGLNSDQVVQLALEKDNFIIKNEDGTFVKLTKDEFVTWLGLSSGYINKAILNADNELVFTNSKDETFKVDLSKFASTGSSTGSNITLVAGTGIKIDKKTTSDGKEEHTISVLGDGTEQSDSPITDKCIDIKYKIDGNVNSPEYVNLDSILDAILKIELAKDSKAYIKDTVKAELKNKIQTFLKDNATVTNIKILSNPTPIKNELVKIHKTGSADNIYASYYLNVNGYNKCLKKIIEDGLDNNKPTFSECPQYSYQYDSKIFNTPNELNNYIKEQKPKYKIKSDSLTKYKTILDTMNADWTAYEAAQRPSVPDKVIKQSANMILYSGTDEVNSVKNKLVPTNLYLVNLCNNTDNAEDKAELPALTNGQCLAIRFEYNGKFYGKFTNMTKAIEKDYGEQRIHYLTLNKLNENHETLKNNASVVNNLEFFKKITTKTLVESYKNVDLMTGIGAESIKRGTIDLNVYLENKCITSKTNKNCYKLSYLWQDRFFNSIADMIAEAQKTHPNTTVAEGLSDAEMQQNLSSDTIKSLFNDPANTRIVTYKNFKYFQADLLQFGLKDSTDKLVYQSAFGVIMVKYCEGTDADSFCFKETLILKNNDSVLTDIKKYREYLQGNLAFESLEKFKQYLKENGNFKLDINTEIKLGALFHTFDNPEFFNMIKQELNAYKERYKSSPEVTGVYSGTVKFNVTNDNNVAKELTIEMLGKNICYEFNNGSTNTDSIGGINTGGSVDGIIMPTVKVITKSGYPTVKDEDITNEKVDIEVDLTKQKSQFSVGDKFIFTDPNGVKIETVFTQAILDANKFIIKSGIKRNQSTNVSKIEYINTKTLHISSIYTWDMYGVNRFNCIPNINPLTGTVTEAKLKEIMQAAGIDNVESLCIGNLYCNGVKYAVHGTTLGNQITAGGSYAAEGAPKMAILATVIHMSKVMYLERKAKMPDYGRRLFINNDTSTNQGGKLSLAPASYYDIYKIYADKDNNLGGFSEALGSPRIINEPAVITITKSDSNTVNELRKVSSLGDIYTKNKFIDIVDLVNDGKPITFETCTKAVFSKEQNFAEYMASYLIKQDAEIAAYLAEHGIKY